MANTLLTISMITREALRVLENQLTFTKQVNTNYDSYFAREGAKIGTSLNVRKPPRYVGRTGQAISIEDATEEQVTITLDTQFGVDITFSSEDLALSIDDFQERFISPAVATVANKLDNDGMALYKTVYNSVGTPATTPNAILTYLTAGVALDNDSCPQDGKRSLVITPLMQATIVDALKGLFQQATAIASQYAKGQMGIAAGFNWYMDQNCNTHTTGVFTTSATPLVNGSTSTGATTLVTDGWNSGSSTVTEGDVFTIAGVNHVNPQSRQSTGSLQQFVVTAATTSSGGAMTIPISPAIKTTTGFQTVDALPADNAALTFVGAESTQSPQGIAFHRDAFCLSSADLPLPGGVDMAARVADKSLGLSIRMVRQYDITTDKWPCRLDILYGWDALRPELACRVQS